MGRLRSRLDEPLRAVGAVFANPDLRRLELAAAGSFVGLYALTVGIAVYAFHHGGATAVGVFLFIRLGAAALVAPIASSLADRYPRERVMLVSGVARLAAMIGVAAAAAAGIPAGVYILGTLSPIFGSVFRPAESALLPVLARKPEELTAANLCSSTFDSIGAFAGPAIGAVLLAFGGPATVFTFVAATFAWSTALVMRIRSPERASRTDEPHDQAPSTKMTAGLQAVAGEPRLRLLFGLYGAQMVVAGAYGVLVIVIALELLGMGNSGVGVLEAASGVGSVLGAGLTLLLIGRGRLAVDFGVGVAAWGAPLVLIGAFPRIWLAVLALGVVGLANTVVDVSAMTLLQRTTPDEIAARVFGLLQSVLVGALALGALAAPLLVHLVGTRWAVVSTGALLPVVSALGYRQLVAIDEGARVPAEQLAALRSVAFLAFLPLSEQEALAAAMSKVDVSAGATLFEQGDEGDRFYILTEGELVVDLPEGPKVESAPSYVGEIALLRDVPRTATVRAQSDAVLWALERDDFLGAVSGHGRSSTAAEAVVASRALASTA